MPFAAERRITAVEAQQYLGIPAGTVRAWASATRQAILAEPETEPPRALYAAGIDKHGQVQYDLQRVVRLWHTTRRNASHVRPTRRRRP